MASHSLFFLDTNIFVYSLDIREPEKARRSQELIREGITSGKGVLSYQVVQEFFNVAFRKFEIPLMPEHAQQYLSNTLQPMLLVHSSPDLIRSALRLLASYSLSWYDSLIVAAALQTNCKVLYSEDMQTGLQIGELKIINPFI